MPLSISSLRKSPRMSHIPDLISSCASIVAVSSIDSVDTLGGSASPGTAFLRCFRVSAHVRPFTLLSRLTFKNISDSGASRFCYSGVWLIWYKMYPSFRAEINRLLPPSSPFTQLPSSCASGSVALIHMKSLLRYQMSSQNVTFHYAERTTMHTCLGHSQLLQMPSIH